MTSRAAAASSASPFLATRSASIATRRSLNRIGVRSSARLIADGLRFSRRGAPAKLPSP